MLKQLRHSIPISGVFFETNKYKLLGLVADWGCFGKLDLIFNYFDEISFGIDVKGNPPKKKLISEDSNTPDVNFVVVVFAFQQLRRNIKRRSTKSLSHRFRTYGPTEIAKLYHSLN